MIVLLATFVDIFASESFHGKVRQACAEPSHPADPVITYNQTAAE